MIAFILAFLYSKSAHESNEIYILNCQTILKHLYLFDLIMVLRSNIVFLLLFVFTRGVAQPANAAKEQLQIDSLLKTIYKTDAPGIAISIIQNEKLIFKNGYGIADRETKTALNSKTNFNIGSLTKQFTALAILQLAERKKLSLDDHLDKFFPGLDKKVAETVTVEELLTHSSGIIDHYELTDTKSLKHAHINDVLNAIQNTDSTYFVPGSHFRYSNTAYCLLSLIVEKVSGVSYAQYLKKNIFKPSGMKKTVVWSEKENIENEASGYEFDSAANSFKKSVPTKIFSFPPRVMAVSTPPAMIT
jgi:CubicO group peptidase (beta-lactamase class C family)